MYANKILQESRGMTRSYEMQYTLKNSTVNPTQQDQVHDLDVHIR